MYTVQKDMETIPIRFSTSDVMLSDHQKKNYRKKIRKIWTDHPTVDVEDRYMVLCDRVLSAPEDLFPSFAQDYEVVPRLLFDERERSDYIQILFRKKKSSSLVIEDDEDHKKKAAALHQKIQTMKESRKPDSAQKPLTKLQEEYKALLQILPEHYRSFVPEPSKIIATPDEYRKYVGMLPATHPATKYLQNCLEHK